MTLLSEGELIWHGDYPADVVERVRQDIASCLNEVLDKAEDLIFHTVFLDDDNYATGPIVMIWGVEGSPALHCEYHAETELVSLGEEPFG